MKHQLEGEDNVYDDRFRVHPSSSNASLDYYIYGQSGLSKAQRITIPLNQWSLARGQKWDGCILSMVNRILYDLKTAWWADKVIAGYFCYHRDLHWHSFKLAWLASFRQFRIMYRRKLFAHTVEPLSHRKIEARVKSYLRPIVLVPARTSKRGTPNPLVRFIQSCDALAIIKFLAKRTSEEELQTYIRDLHSGWWRIHKGYIYVLSVSV